MRLSTIVGVFVPLLSLACRAEAPEASPGAVSDGLRGTARGTIPDDYPSDSDTAADSGVDSGDSDTAADSGDVDPGDSDTAADSGDVDPGDSDTAGDSGDVDPGDSDTAADSGDVDPGDSDSAADSGDVDPGDTAVDPVDTDAPGDDDDCTPTEEVCNALDDDCDGEVDEDTLDAYAWFADADGDGFGDESVWVSACDAPAGYVPDLGDCDDADATVSPGGTETCNGVDDDCDGTVDAGAVDAPVGYLDGDGDGFGGVAIGGDCGEMPSDLVAEGGDCDDDVAWVYPGADEWCDGLDTNCDADPDAGALDAFTWFADADRDAYGDAVTAVTQCDAPSGYVPDLGDCDDTDPAVAPDAVETCNGRDDDCSGVADDNGGACTGVDTGDTADTGGGGPRDTGALDTGADTGVDTGDPDPGPDCERTWHPDLDADGAGDDAVAVTGCAPDASWIAVGGDCDDTDPDVFVGAPEQCNGGDDDCDGEVDEDATDASLYRPDADGDGYGDAAAFLRACAQPTGYTTNGDDCDDTDPAVSPDGVEVCDGIDNDCGEGVDEVSALDALTWYADWDGDGVAGDTTRRACTQPLNAYPTSGDCDDVDPDVYPGADEVCNDVDDDCNGLVDDATTDGAGWFYRDGDDDGYGDPSTGTWSCSTPVGYVADDQDCDDTTRNAAPGRREQCDRIDNDCDGAIDEAGASGEKTWYADTDGDGAGDSSSTTRACDAPSGYVADYRDCDDGEPAAFPANVETCGDGIDNDCDGLSELCGPWGERDVDAADAILLPDAAGDDAGRSVAFVGDVDGDGLDDAAIGAIGHDAGGPDAGLVWVISGAPTGVSELSSVGARLLGDTADDQVGWAVAPAGDLDGDGFADLLVGADAEGTGGAYAGGVFVVAGPLAGDMDIRSGRALLYGALPGDRAGYSVDGGQDHDDDGTPDVLVGAPYEDSGGSKAGAVYVVPGGTTGVVAVSVADGVRTGERALDRAGAAAAFWGDADGDGFADLVVGAWGESSGGTRAGAVYLVLGPVTGVSSLSGADEKWLGEEVGDRSGSVVAGGGDLDGDGLDDALVGAAYGSRAYLLGAGSRGASSLAAAVATFDEVQSGSGVGSSLGGRGDVDGDGHLDVLIGASSVTDNGPDSGASYLVRGPFSGSHRLVDADATLLGMLANDALGTSGSIAGDLDGDGLSDVLLGSPGFDEVGAGAGAAWLFYGVTP